MRALPAFAGGFTHSHFDTDRLEPTMNTATAALLNDIRWNDQGLLPVIAQDATNKRVLMLAWMNRDALKATIAKGEAVYWSRSRQRLWHKGESSGHTQRIEEMRLDCDGDTLLLLVEQRGGIACHTGRESCMYRKQVDGDRWQIIDTPIKDPHDIYQK